MNRILIFISSAAVLISSCRKDKTFDASGVFEAEETIISSEASGKILSLQLDEGMKLKAGNVIGFVDSTQLYLKKLQLEAQLKAVLGRRPDINTQLAAFKEQLATLETEKIRVQNLVNAKAATTKQLDDINAQIEVLKKQIDAQSSSLHLSSESVTNESRPVELQIRQLEDQLAKCRIINPVNGSVLTQYVREQEVVFPGKPLYKIADLSNITLRTFISADQLPNIKLNQKVKVFTDDGKGGYHEDSGIVTWIADQAEFTPKTVQTKDERANMVYAVKIQVKNDGTYKIGMYGAINLK
ncbi:MAG: HlyD family efflux transporter periplasmic adaptor subunit [Bacteroidetes bacterium]|nr:HlyD family efflux transporter periplasmic adaptor subunit [Bacteroidota bacterium]